MSLYKLFKTDQNLETDGIFIEYGNASNGAPVRIKIARAGGSNKGFSKALEKATRPYRKAIQSGLLDNATADRLYKDVFADTVVLGWENVEGPDGKALPFNRENVLKLFEDLPDLFADLREQASNVALFREEVLEADLGNSGRSSATGSSKDQ
ncbi:MAG: hypothetical protein RBT55_03655 [Rhodocyclaceae bacterium]|jgi:hypothetical protein|nr:hypothetical protein [Rhodocyclaceae bacterium]